MASDLESELRTAVRNGFLHLTLMKEWKGPNWSCGYRTTEVHNCHYEVDPDPVEAIRKALRAGTRAEKAQEKSVAAKRQTRNLDDLV